MSPLSRSSVAQLLVIALASQATALTTTSRCGGGGGNGGGNPAPAAGKALYLITNDEAANAVVSLRVGPDGKLSPGRVTPTNGTGSIALNSMGQPATPDALVSQSALTIAGDVSSSFPSNAMVL